MPHKMIWVVRAQKKNMMDSLMRESGGCDKQKVQKSATID